MEILRTTDLSWRYSQGPWVLEGVDLTVRAGEYVLLCGRSGSGKSTLARACNGLIPHFHVGTLRGFVVVDGLDTRRHRVWELFHRVGLVFQNADAQLFNSTVARELAYGLESLGLPRDEIRRRVDWAAETVGLGPLLDRPPFQLSGGEKQLVTIGAILALRPAVVVLDEPFVHLDPVAGERLRETLRTIHRLGTTVIVIEHRLEQALADAGRVVVLDRGHIALDGTPAEVLQADLSQYGLAHPPLVRLFRQLGLPATPICVQEAADWLRTSVYLDTVLRVLEDGPGRTPTAPRLGVRSNDFSRSVAHDHPQSTTVTTTDQSGVRSNDFSRSVAHDPRQSTTEVVTTTAAPSDQVIVVEDVSYAFQNQPALRGVNLSIGRGECVALLGHNGSGKTTLVKHFNGLYRPASGRVMVLGRDTRKTPVAELVTQVGLVFQNANDQFFQPSVRQEILTGPRALRREDPAWCEALFDRFHLRPLLDRSPFRLSEGQKKRVTFAAALAAKPQVVVLDEPTTGQDVDFRQALGRLLRQLRGEGHTIILVTHDVEFAAQHAGRWIVLANGRVVADGSPQAVMANGDAMAAAGLKPTQSFQLAQVLGRFQQGGG